MILTIDSEGVEFPVLPNETFQAYLARVSGHLLKDRRSIGTCQIDGKPIQTFDDGDSAFAAAGIVAIESVPLHVAVQASIALQCNAIRKIEDDCEGLVTDSLLADPRQVAQSWQALCESVKGVLAFLPGLAGLLTDKQLDSLIDDKLATLNAVMKEIAEALNKGDVVTFSDTLELKLAPWLAGLREFLQAQLAAVEALGVNSGEKG